MSEDCPRYVLRELTGYPKMGGGSSSYCTTDVYVMDSFYGYAVVAQWPGRAAGRDRDLAGRRREATAMLDRLNGPRKGRGSR